MPARLTVVVSQSAQRDPAFINMEETLVAELMMTPGLDATMIGPLEYVQSDDTDYLCVSSFNHNLVLVSRLDTPSLAEHWRRLGLNGSVVPFSEDSNSSIPTNGRRIYHLRPEGTTDLATVMDSLKNMLASRQVQVVPIGLEAAGVSHSAVTSSQPSKRSQTQESPKKLSQESTASTDSAPDEVGESARQVEGLRTARAAAELKNSSRDDGASTECEVSERQSRELDQLVDDFDALDL